MLDTKWKRVDAAGRDKSYDLIQADFYQLHAYGHTYMNGAGDMVLIYPRTAAFAAYLGPFSFNAALRLWVLPFDLDAGTLVAPVAVQSMMFGESVASA